MYEIRDMSNLPDGRKIGEDKDLVWMMCHAMVLSIPMWTGFAAAVHVDHLP